jgi:hypothetical protein
MGMIQNGNVLRKAGDHHHPTPAPACPVSSGQMNRRHALLSGIIGAFSVYALVREARAAAGVQDGRLPARRWIDRQEELARGLHSGAVSEADWHEEVNRLAGEVDIGSLTTEMRRARVTEAGAPFMRDPVKRHIRFMDEDGRPMRLAYAAATFTFDPTNVITPHAHKHMASAHMVIDGRVRVRTFDRVAEEEGALVIRPTGDRVAEVGEAAAMTTSVDNVHWFTPRSARATTFDVIISGLDAGERPFLIQPVDPLGGTVLGDGAIRAPLLGFEESMQLYPPTR